MIRVEMRFPGEISFNAARNSYSHRIKRSRHSFKGTCNRMVLITKVMLSAYYCCLTTKPSEYSSKSL